MKVFYAVFIGLGMIFLLIGCEGISKPYVMKMDRVDQNVSVGNQGYLKGTPPPAKDRGDLKRPFIAVDIDLLDMAGSEAAKTKEVSKSEEAAVTREAPVVKEERRVVK